MTSPSPAAPEGWQRLDPRTLGTQPFSIAVRAAIPALAGVIGFGQAIGFGYAIPIMLVGVVVAGAIPWATTTYRVTPTHLEIRRGLLNRQTVTARLDRVRSVDLEADVFHRVLGVTKVSVGTGVDEGGLSLDSLGVQAAERLRAALLHGEHDVSPAPQGSAGYVPPPPAPPAIVGLDWSWVRFAPLNIANLAVVLGAIGALASQFDTLFEGERIEAAWHWLRDTDIPLVLALVVVGGLVLWVPVACVGYLVRWFGLSVTREQGKEGPTLRRVYGLLTQRATTIEEAKIRGTVVRRRALVGLAGGAELCVLTIGLERNETHLLPSAPRAVVDATAADVLGEAAAVTAPTVPHGWNARRRAHLRNLRAVLYGTTGAAIAAWRLDAVTGWLPLGVLVIGLPIAFVLAELRYHRLGHALTERYLISGTGTTTAARTALELDGIIGWRIHQSLFDRRLGLAQLTATTAAGSERVVVPDVPLDEAIALVGRATPAMAAEFLQ
ncbi:PH domain-containing protein [Nocardioides nematodiphilus]|uniref:PH domain-containing protein n=1 Tax=Nocardioides nematodiphilus TaxID=2849669 RepID=UPI001CD9C973|nr:PH domain-containing protein [Nocardioides nematodiphilus]MCA1982910.1 PH domain-containing protein [Nocardioides nematodiphilus]